MNKPQDPAEPASNREKFKPANVADGSPANARPEHDMHDVAKGSEGDRRRNAQNRSPDKG